MRRSMQCIQGSVSSNSMQSMFLLISVHMYYWPTLYLFSTGAVPGWSESTLRYPQGSQHSLTKGVPQRNR